MITVHKLDHQGIEKLTYIGDVLQSTATQVILEARFAGRRMELGYVTLMPGDRFVEHFFTDRWYNVFAIYDVADDTFKGWYCNLTRPARFEADHIWADDLALDYFVQPGGQAFILDEAEFAALALTAPEAAQVQAALAELQTLAARQAGPFNPEALEQFRPSKT